MYAYIYSCISCLYNFGSNLLVSAQFWLYNMGFLVTERLPKAKPGLPCFPVLQAVGYLSSRTCSTRRASDELARHP